MDYDHDTDNVTLEESIKAVMPTLPPVVRQYLSTGKYSDLARSLTLEHHLHLDQGAVVERELMLLIMGLESLQDFVGQLKTEANIPDDAIREIVDEINQKAFMPMHDQMREVGNTPPPPPVHTPPPAPTHPPIPPLSKPPAPTPHPIPPARPGNNLPPRHILPGALPPAQVVNNPFIARPPQRPVPPPAPLRAVPPASRPEPAVPPNLPTGAERPVSPAPPRYAPSAPPPHPAPSAEPTAPPLSSEAPRTAPHTRYPSDPYREPVE